MVVVVVLESTNLKQPLELAPEVCQKSEPLALNESLQADSVSATRLRCAYWKASERANEQTVRQLTRPSTKWIHHNASGRCETSVASRSLRVEVRERETERVLASQMPNPLLVVLNNK